jgi:hypothetical protein
LIFILHAPHPTSPTFIKSRNSKYVNLIKSLKLIAFLYFILKDFILFLKILKVFEFNFNKIELKLKHCIYFLYLRFIKCTYMTMMDL